MGSETKWDVFKLTIFLSVLASATALVALGKLNAETVYVGIFGLLSPSMLPFGRKTS